MSLTTTVVAAAGGAAAGRAVTAVGAGAASGFLAKQAAKRGIKQFDVEQIVRGTAEGVAGQTLTAGDFPF